MLSLCEAPKPVKEYLETRSAEEGQLHLQESSHCSQPASDAAELECPKPVCCSCRIVEMEEGTNLHTYSQRIACAVQQHDYMTVINKPSDFQLIFT